MFANLLYIAALVLVSPLVLYRSIRHGRYRRGVSQKLLGLSRLEAQSLVQNANAESCLAGCDCSQGNCSRKQFGCVWVHAVSVGEVNLLPNLVRRLEKERPDSLVVISTSTDTGYDLAVKHFGEARVFFCRLDFTWAV